MPDVEELKSRARRAEAAGDYRLALESYREALERERETTDPDMMDPALRLRVADLRFRLGEPDRALDAYLEASELYARQGLIPNAIAVCNKVLGVYPDHIECHRHLAELQLKIGLTADARRNLLRYVEEAGGRGRAASVREAGEAFLEEEPDQDVAIAVAELLAGEGRTDRALDVLRDTWAKRTGLRQPAGRIEAFARELDPGADLSEWQPVWPPPRRRQRTPADGAAVEEVEEVEEVGAEVEAGDAEVEAGEAPQGETAPERPPRTAAALEDLPAGREPPAGRVPPAGREPPVGTESGAAPTGPPPRHNGARMPEADETSSAESDGQGRAPLGDHLVPGGSGEAPSARSPGSAAAVAGDEASGTDSRSDPHDASGPEPSDPDGTAGSERELRLGLELVEEMLEVAPDHLDLHRRRVLYARRLGDLRLLERALVELGEVLLERGSHRGARFVFEEVREQLNPGSARASEGLRRLDRREASPGDRDMDEAAGDTSATPDRVPAETSADRHFRRRLREALASSSREMAWLHAAAERCGAGGSGPVAGPSHELLGRYLLMRGRTDEAVEHLRTALDRAPSRGERSAELLYHLGRAWRRADEPARARDCFERLAETDADFRAAWDVVDPDVR